MRQSNRGVMREREGVTLTRAAPLAGERYILPVAAGLVAGESLMGIVTIAFHVLG